VTDATADPSRLEKLVVHTSALVTGAVVVGALLVVAAQSASESRLVITATGVLIIYWLTHAYADALSHTLTDRTRLAGQFLVSAKHDSAILLGGAPGLVVFAVSLGFADDFSSAVLNGLWTTIVFLGAVGAVAGYRTGLRGWRLVGESLLAGSAGVFMLLLKTLLHH
jgi:hypothetical protein